MPGLKMPNPMVCKCPTFADTDPFKWGKCDVSQIRQIGYFAGVPMRTPTVQLGGSLAGKLSSRLSSTISSWPVTHFDFSSSPAACFESSPSPPAAQFDFSSSPVGAPPAAYFGSSFVTRL
jgi:hypothetical protein